MRPVLIGQVIFVYHLYKNFDILRDMHKLYNA